MHRVLVIDDDPAMTDLLRIILTSNQMEVKVVNDGQAGLDSLASYKPNIIILDLLMPELDGWKVCQRIKEFNQIPILILSAVDSPSKIAEALDAGADGYLIKPVTTTSLIALINNLVKRTTGELRLIHTKT
ncbi:MAG: response regulator [Anaerolineaceae bacterium]|jgi:two-component system KDP operon response regulator KdpE|nr:response regulator [Anaerolineaceae bacterium]